MLLFHTLQEQIWTILMLAVSAFAWWRGGWPERTVAVANVVASLASGLAENRHDFIDPQWGVMTIDVLFLAMLVWLVVRSDRRWPMFAAAFQLLAVVTHGAMMADPSVGGWAYITGYIIWGYLVLTSLGVGAWFVARDRLRGGAPA